MRLILIGFGVVGQGFAEILRDKMADLRATYNLSPRIVGVYTRSHGSLYHADGLDIGALLNLIKSGTLDDYPYLPGMGRSWDALRLIRKSGADTMIEVTPTNLQDAQPALDHVRAALNAGMHVVTANKGPIALAYNELRELAAKKGRYLRFESTVMAGTPSIRLGMQALAGCTITAARGILNGTTNYMLTQMETGMDYARALAQAQALGYAEADPTADVDGWDAAGKALILAAALFDKSLTLNDLEVAGIRNISPHDIWTAGERGERWKLIAEVTPEGGRVAPISLPKSHPLAGAMGATNAVTYTTDLLGDVTLVGAGAGRTQTGFGILSDVLDIHRLTSR
ncbi:MAG: homoserine dehydrogenase [Chloroflexota bacterium]|nr:homoserine dehydrogenase [Chloroflexota bacterium]